MLGRKINRGKGKGMIEKKGLFSMGGQVWSHKGGNIGAEN